jgi:hypothetical protein
MTITGEFPRTCSINLSLLLQHCDGAEHNSENILKNQILVFLGPLPISIFTDRMSAFSKHPQE